MTNDKRREAQARYRHKRRGITAKPIASLYRDYDTFGALLIVPDTLSSEMLVVRWLVRGVSEAEARAVLEQAK